MTDYQKLIEILSNQAPTGVKSGNWEKIRFNDYKKGKEKVVTIESAEVGFEFNSRGRFAGIFNWKE